MNKDVIYIDIEDDITAIIAKVKSSSSKIVALVPPKRAGVLQSMVNLRLLKKAAEAKDKHVVLITSDHALVALASGVRMPIAKNLQSRPEIPTLATPVTNEDEVIDGAELSVGEMDAAMGKKPQDDSSVADKLSEDIDLTDAPKASDLADKKADKKPADGKKGKGGFKIPDFMKFRNKILIFGGIGLFLIIFLVWALVFAPHASVKISAETIGVDANKTLALNAQATTDASKLTLKANVQQIKKPVSATFNATGQKDIGNKASGSINIVNCDSSGSFDIAANTVFTAADGHTFVSNAKATVPGYTSPTASACNNNPGNYAGKVTIPVTASALGDEYNISATTFSVNVPVVVSAKSSAAMAGGTHQMATVVTQADVDKAVAQIAQPNENDVKNELKKQFTGDVIVIEESYAANAGAPVIEPAVGQPAQQGKVTIEYVYTYVGIERNDAKAVLTDVVNAALEGKTDQQMYSLGDNSLKFQSFSALPDGTFNVRMITTAHIGPKIDTAALAKQITGKRYGEIQSMISQIPGVKNVDVTMSPFWVNTAPSTDKIDITFTVANGQ